MDITCRTERSSTDRWSRLVVLAAHLAAQPRVPSEFARERGAHDKSFLDAVVSSTPIPPATFYDGLLWRLSCWNAAHPEDPWTVDRLIAADYARVFGHRVAFDERSTTPPAIVRGTLTSVAYEAATTAEMLLVAERLRLGFHQILVHGRWVVACDPKPMLSGAANALARVLPRSATAEVLERSWMAAVALESERDFEELLTPAERDTLVSALIRKLVAVSDASSPDVDTAAYLVRDGYLERRWSRPDGLDDWLPLSLLASRPWLPGELLRPSLLHETRLPTMLRVVREAEHRNPDHTHNLPERWARCIARWCSVEQARELLPQLPFGDVVQALVDELGVKRPEHWAELLSFEPTRALAVFGIRRARTKAFYSGCIVDFSHESSALQAELRRCLLEVDISRDIPLALDTLAADIADEATRRRDARDDEVARFDALASFREWLRERPTPHGHAESPATKTAREAQLIEQLGLWVRNRRPHRPASIIAALEVLGLLLETCPARASSVVYEWIFAYGEMHEAPDPHPVELEEHGAAFARVGEAALESLWPALGRVDRFVAALDALDAERTEDNHEVRWGLSQHLRNLAVLAEHGSPGLVQRATEALLTLHHRMRSYGSFWRELDDPNLGTAAHASVFARLARSWGKLPDHGREFALRLQREGLEALEVLRFAAGVQDGRAAEDLLSLLKEVARKEAASAEDVFLTKALALAEGLSQMGRHDDAVVFADRVLADVGPKPSLHLDELADRALVAKLSSLRRLGRVREVAEYPLHESAGVTIQKAWAFAQLGAFDTARSLLWKRLRDLTRRPATAALLGALIDLALTEGKIAEAKVALDEADRRLRPAELKAFEVARAIILLDLQGPSAAIGVIRGWSEASRQLPAAVLLRARLVLATSPEVSDIRKSLDRLSALAPSLAEPLRRKLAVIPSAALGVSALSGAETARLNQFEDLLDLEGFGRDVHAYLGRRVAAVLSLLAQHPTHVPTTPESGTREDWITDHVAHLMEASMERLRCSFVTRVSRGFGLKKEGTPDLVVNYVRAFSPQVLLVGEAKVWSTSLDAHELSSGLAQLFGTANSGDERSLVLLVYSFDDDGIDAPFEAARAAVSAYGSASYKMLQLDEGDEELRSMLGRDVRVLRSKHQHGRSKTSRPRELLTFVVQLGRGAPADIRHEYPKPKSRRTKTTK